LSLIVERSFTIREKRYESIIIYGSLPVNNNLGEVSVPFDGQNSNLDAEAAEARDKLVKIEELSDMKILPDFIATATSCRAG